jgi:hypothetical protein
MQFQLRLGWGTLIGIANIYTGQNTKAYYILHVT